MYFGLAFPCVHCIHGIKTALSWLKGGLSVHGLCAGSFQSAHALTHTRCIHKVHSQLLHAVDVTEIRTLHLRLIDRDSVDLGRDTDTALIFF